MSKAKRYTLETLLPLNVSYDSDHELTQEDVDMVNSLVEVIESTRSKHTPKIGDRVVYTQKGGEYHPHGLIEKKHEDKFYVCLDPFIPFVWESDTAIKVDVSGGPFYHADADKFKFIGWTEADFKEWGHCGATANGTVRFKAKVPLWAYSEPNPLYGDFTTKDWKKITLRKRKEGNLYDSMQIAFRDEDELQEYVKENHLDVGFAFDGDADRVMFVDENSRFISPDLMIAVLGHYFLEERGEKGYIHQDIRSSKAVGEYLAPMGGVMNTWRVGRAYAALKLREIDGVYGGELAGHYYFRDFYYSDSGLLAAILIVNVIAKMKAKGVTLSQLIGRIEKYQNSGEINFRLEDKKGAMDAVRDYFMQNEKSTAYMDFDGYRVEFPDWWFNIRPSNTEPYLRFLCEATTKELLDEKVAKVREILTEQFGAK